MSDLLTVTESARQSGPKKRGIPAMSNADIRGRFVWHELMTTDTAAAGAFYSKVLPWKSQPSGMPGYTLWHVGKTQAAGLMSLPEHSAADAQPQWLLYIGTPSVDTAAEDVQRLGGKVLKAAADIPNVGRFAIVSDPQGATFALFTPASGSGDGAAQPGGPGDFAWHELSTTDLNGAVSFYTELFGWEKGPGHDMGGEMGVYQILVRGGKQVGGIYKAPGAATPPSWLSYTQVADVSKAAAIAKNAGARILNGPHQVPGGSWIAQIMDPQGGTFAVHEPARAAAADHPAADKPSQAAKPAKPAQAAKPAQVAKATPAPKSAPPPKPVAAATKPAAPAAKSAKKTAKKAAKTAAAKPSKGKAKGKAAAGAKSKSSAKKGPKKAASKGKAAKRGAAGSKRGKSAARKPGKAKAKAKAKAKGKGKRR